MPVPSPPHSALLPFAPNCVHGTLLQRVKRFSVECIVNGVTLWAHTNNSGSMLGLLRKGSPVLLSPAPNPDRKLSYTLELIGLTATTAQLREKTAHSQIGNLPTSDKSLSPLEPLWVGVNTLTPNRLLRAAFTAGKLPWAAGYTHFQAEARRGQSRLDALLTAPGLPALWVECKNVTMVEDGGVAAFPDAVTERGQKHMREMMDIVQGGEKAAFFYCIQRADGECFAPADFIDPAYAALFYEGLAAGVAAYPHRVAVSPAGIDIGALLPIARQHSLAKG